MRVALLWFTEDGPSSGVGQKLLAQTRALTAAGADVRLVVGAPAERAVEWTAIADGVIGLAVAMDAPGARALPGVWRQQRQVLATVEAHRPDVVYLRHPLWFPGLDRLATRLPVVLEVNGDDTVELRTVAPRKHVLNRATRGLLLRRARGLVVVSHELARRRAFARYERPVLVLGNAVDLDAHPPLAPTTAARARLVFVGSPSMAWHGVDRLLDLARRRPQWDVDVVGAAAPDGHPVPDNVVFHGVLTGEALAAVIAQADVGVGSLAMHRAGLSEASPLKSRQYLAHGLPVVAGYRDTDLGSESEVVLEVPSEDGPLDAASLERLTAFVARWHGRRVDRSLVQHLTHDAKAQARLGFLHAVLEGGSTR
jgi:glycosyltransferase involved in cell wall biosynthesis